MPKVVFKNNKSPKLDMNPMVDLAFLLVTFFMLTTTFKLNEPFEISNPTSVSELKLPQQNFLIISINDSGKVFIDIDGKFTREKLLDFMGQEFNLSFTEEEKNSFGILNSIGMPFSQLPNFLKAAPSTRNQYIQSGIPIDSSANELKHWLIYARAVNPLLRIGINADQKTKYKDLHKVITTLTSNKIHRFNLITDKKLNPIEQ